MQMTSYYAGSSLQNIFKKAFYLHIREMLWWLRLLLAFGNLSFWRSRLKVIIHFTSYVALNKEIKFWWRIDLDKTELAFPANCGFCWLPPKDTHLWKILSFWCCSLFFCFISWLIRSKRWLIASIMLSWLPLLNWQLLGYSQDFHNFPIKEYLISVKTSWFLHPSEKWRTC